MAADIEPNGDFVEKWIAKRKEENELDQRMLDLIQHYQKSDGSLNESELQKNLMAYAKDLEAQDDED